MFTDSSGINSSTKEDQDKEVLVGLLFYDIKYCFIFHTLIWLLLNIITLIVVPLSKCLQACCSVTVNFEGVKINSKLLPTLQAIWAKHGSLIGKETVRSKPILACVLESSARLMITLQNTMGRSLTDFVVDDITSTLSNLQRAGLKVNWLAPTVEKALNKRKSRPEIESIMVKTQE